jgi:hypothetical protein
VAGNVAISSDDEWSNWPVALKSGRGTQGLPEVEPDLPGFAPRNIHLAPLELSTVCAVKLGNASSLFRPFLRARL